MCTYAGTWLRCWRQTPLGWRDPPDRVQRARKMRHSCPSRDTHQPQCSPHSCLSFAPTYKQDKKIVTRNIPTRPSIFPEEGVDSGGSPLFYKVKKNGKKCTCQYPLGSSFFVTKQHTLDPAYNDFGYIIDSNVKKFGYFEHPPTTSSFLCIYLLVLSGAQCICKYGT